MNTRPPARRAIASTNRASPGSSPSMKKLIAAPNRVSSSTWPTVARSVSWVVGQWKSGVPSARDVRGRLAVGDHQHDRLGVGVPAQVPRREHQRVLEVGALHPLRLDVGELHRREPPGGQVEADDLQRVLPEPGLHQVRERERGLLHRPPAALVHHRERQVDAERDRGRRTPLGLDHLEVLDQQPARGCRPPRRSALDTVRTASMGSSSPNTHGRVVPVSSSADPVRWSSWSPAPAASICANTRLSARLPQPAYGARGQPQPVVAAGHEALPLQLALQLAQRLEVGGRAGAEVLLEGLHVDVVEGRAGAGLAERLLERLEVGELGDRLDGVAVAQRLAALAHVHRPAVQPGPQRAQVVGELRHLRGQVGVGHRVAHQLAELLALLAATARPSSGRRRPAGGPARRSARRRSRGAPGTGRRACP